MRVGVLGLGENRGAEVLSLPIVVGEGSIERTKF